ncbi:hypothetical protein IGI04_040819 [Brassica rapa subsp. trilocularis]|uniref:RING-type domain-containing protein n=1 Tax=Brassica rapa subsp. trilocularis TaxID=1813537 RepID=A0ABQ7KP05_BRACM|nr:hypothetical protein IGI04_040819 [Brassica rapa subsp. trilocularis]
MDSKEKEDHVKSLITSREMLLKLQQNIETATTGPSASTSADLQNLSNEIQKHLMKTAATAQDPNKPDPSKATSHIKDELDKVFTVEEVGHKCDLCGRDLASDPERPNVSLRSLQEVCVLDCGHVYHFKCLKGTTLDLDNRSTNPSCIFCGHLTFNNPAVQGTFVGVYDGHGGPEGSRFIADNLFPNLKKFAFEGGEVSEEVMRNAFAETDEDFLS